MSFEAVLGNKEFEFIVSEVTLTVVTRVILPHQNNLLLLALTLVQYSIIQTNEFIALPIFSQFISFMH
jgi:hypothetical protein